MQTDFTDKFHSRLTIDSCKIQRKYEDRYKSHTSFIHSHRSILQFHRNKIQTWVMSSYKPCCNLMSIHESTKIQNCFNLARIKETCVHTFMTWEVQRPVHNKRNKIKWKENWRWRIQNLHAQIHRWSCKKNQKWKLNNKWKLISVVETSRKKK
jgi:hypothetical protein